MKHLFYPDLIRLTGFKAFLTGINKGLNKLSFSASLNKFDCNFAVPSIVLRTTLPVNPSVMKTSALLFAKSLPSHFQQNLN